MTKKALTLERVRLQHQKGDLKKAKKGYLALLKHLPNNSDVLHGLGILSIQMDHLEEAIPYLEKAIALKPEDPTLSLHLANAFKMQGLFNKAIQLLEKTIARHPDYLPAYNNMGTLFYAQGKLSDAIFYFETTIQKKPDYWDAYYNLGLAFSKKNDLTQAINTFKILLNNIPDHFAARYLLGVSYMEQNKSDSAIQEFLTIEKMHPFHFETESNLAACYLKKGDVDHAKAHYLKALELRPKDIQILFNLGVITMQQGYVDSAINYYQAITEINPTLFEVHNNLGVAFLAKNHIGYALTHFQKALAIEPHNKTIQYTVAMLQQNQRLLAAPPDYIQSLFDAYADHYDSHLLQALEYKIPVIFYGALKKYLSHHPLDILDLGCGTGLTATPFKPHAKSLTGVDLSAAMLKKAKEKNMYDTLQQSDILDFLNDKKSLYDLILAGDVLVYLGDLQLLFLRIFDALKPQGLFIYNAEITEDNHFKMNQSGRFSHHDAYLHSLAASSGFKTIDYQKIITRLQNNEPVYGHLVILKREG